MKVDAGADVARLLIRATKWRGSTFSCVLTGATIRRDYIKAEGMAGRMGERLMAIVAEGQRRRMYLSSDTAHERVAISLQEDSRVADAREGALGQPVPERLTGGTCYSYGLTTFGKLFTSRQLIALTTFSDLVGEAREKVLADAGTEGSEDAGQLHEGGTGAVAYADAVATYLALSVSKLSAAQSAIGVWKPSMEQAIAAFGRQAIAMTWDFPESNIFNGMAGDIGTTINNMMRILDAHSISGEGEIFQINATKNAFPLRPIVISTDPPYYDNIGYADLSDFFYLWLKHSLADVWPDLFRRLSTPKQEELVATSYRHGGREQAEIFFMQGMGEALTAMWEAAVDGEPLAIYYAFKQSEIGEDGVTSAGWASFLQAVLDVGLVIDGTWPVRTELVTALKAGANALAASIVLICRKHTATQTVTRAGFLRALKREMPEAVEKIRKASVGPVDMPQSVIGPGMGVFTRYARVLEDDDSTMSVKTALALINRVWGEIENDLDANFDPETQVALAWFATYGFDARASGDLIGMANAKNIPIEALFRSGVFQNLHGKAGLTPREKLSPGWSPVTDKAPTVWECVQHTARVLRAEDGGAEPAAKLVGAMGARAEDARALAYRLYEISSQKGWAAEALVYNELAQDWTHLEDQAARQQIPAIRDLFGAIAP
jgi:putative DNA methylase